MKKLLFLSLGLILCNNIKSAEPASSSTVKLNDLEEVLYTTTIKYEKKEDGTIIRNSYLTKEGDDTVLMKVTLVFNPGSKQVNITKVDLPKSKKDLMAYIVNTENATLGFLENVEKSCENYGVKIHLISAYKQLDGITSVPVAVPNEK